MLSLDMIQTLALGGLALLGGYLLRRIVPVLGRLNLPAAVLGGLLVSLAVLLGHLGGVQPFRFDTTLQSPLMIAFFTTVGFAASLSLLKIGGPQVLRFFALATGFAVLQNLVGIGVALAFGLPPLFGVLAGSVTLTGGPATGLAFAPLFEAVGIAGAASIAVATAMAGIVAGALVGSPVATWLIERHGLGGRARRVAQPAVPVPPVVVHEAPAPHLDADDDAYLVLKNVVAVLLAMWGGSYVSAGFASLGITLPAYIGAMLVAAVIRNVDDATGMVGLSQRTIDDLGNGALSRFLVLALMTLRLWELAGLALPMVVILVCQVGLIAAVCFWPV